MKRYHLVDLYTQIIEHWNSMDTKPLRKTGKRASFLKHFSDFMYANTFPTSPNFLGYLSPHTKLNHFRRHIEITHKDCLCINMRRMQSIAPEEYRFVPTGFILPQVPNIHHFYLSTKG